MRKSMVIAMIAILFSGCFQEAPKCSNKEVLGLLQKLLNTDHITGTILNDYIIETDINDKKNIRTCKTRVDFQYKVDENNKWSAYFKKEFMGNSRLLNNIEVKYEVMLNDSGDKYIVSLLSAITF